MARKTEKPGSKPTKKSVIIRSVLIPVADHRGKRGAIEIVDAEGRTHRVSPSPSVGDDVRKFVAGRAFRVTGKTNDCWLAITASPPKPANPEAQQFALLKEAEE